jgi:hypothetical protein
MSDLSDSNPSDLERQDSDDNSIDTTEDDDFTQRIFDLSSRLQNYCRNQGLPIFNESQTTTIILEMLVNSR